MKTSLKKTLFFVEEKHSGSGGSEYEIIQAANVENFAEALYVLKASIEYNNPQLSIQVLTDPFEYQGKDQVIPLQPEQLFFMDYTNIGDIRDRQILEVGLGSGVLSIFCLRKGAAHCTGLDINPRAKIYTGFNAVLNHVEDRLEIRDGDINNIFAPVQDKSFDFIFSNPPFEPTPPDMDYYFNSAAGIYGLTFIEDLLKGINSVLNDGGIFQMVTMAPGDENEPFMLYDLIGKYLPGTDVEVVLDLQPISYNGFVDRFVHIFNEDQSKILKMKEEASLAGVTHLHMLILKYRKGSKGKIRTTNARKTYETWSSPLGVANALYPESI